MPRAPWRIRPALIQFCANLNPSPSSPMRFSTGTRTSSKAISQGRSSIIVSCGLSSFTPGVFMSTRKPDMPPRDPFSRSVAAKTWAKSASSAPVMNRFVPLIT